MSFNVKINVKQVGTSNKDATEVCIKYSAEIYLRL